MTHRVTDWPAEARAEAVAGIADGATVLLAGFGAGTPEHLVAGLIEQGAKDLTLVCNAGGRDDGPAAIGRDGRGGREGEACFFFLIIVTVVVTIHQISRKLVVHNDPTKQTVRL